MNWFKNSDSAKTSRFYIIRIAIAVCILLIYLLLVRPTRILITEKMVSPQVEMVQHSQSDYHSSFQGGSLNVLYRFGDDVKELSYRPQFGFFFLIALIPLLFVASTTRPYALLVGLHLGGSILAYLCLMIGIMGSSIGFVLTDAINGYVVPGLSLAIVPLQIKGFIPQSNKSANTDR